MKEERHYLLQLIFSKTAMKKPIFLLALLLPIWAQSVLAQFSVDGQIIQRAEYRHGFGTLLQEGQEPAAFIGQRARLNASYKMEKATFMVSVQDVRTWGNTPQVKATDPYLSVHEAWVEVPLSTHWSVKLGRQELNYDNFRFLGNLDWALQARAHDFALLKYEKEAFKLHVGGGYNQDAEKLSGNLFTIPNQYKVAQLVRAENTWGNLHVVGLFWNDGRQYAQTNAAGVVTEKGVRYMQTVGLPMVRYHAGSLTFSGFYYHQLGRKPDNRQISAFNASAQVSKLFDINTEKGQKFRLTGGFELISGTGPDTDPLRSASYSPLYGTNHLYNGYMDLFFVGGRYENAHGLQDLFVRTRYDFSEKFFLSACAHNFSSYADIRTDQGLISRQFEQEVDLSFGWVINQAFSLQGGYSQLFATNSLEQALNKNQADPIQNWAYLMFICRPTMKNKFIGMLF